MAGSNKKGSKIEGQGKNGQGRGGPVNWRKDTGRVMKSRGKDGKGTGPIFAWSTPHKILDRPPLSNIISDRNGSLRLV